MNNDIFIIKALADEMYKIFSLHFEFSTLPSTTRNAQSQKSSDVKAKLPYDLKYTNTHNLREIQTAKQFDRGLIYFTPEHL